MGATIRKLPPVRDGIPSDQGARRDSPGQAKDQATGPLADPEALADLEALAEDTSSEIDVNPRRRVRSE